MPIPVSSNSSTITIVGSAGAGLDSRREDVLRRLDVALAVLVDSPAAELRLVDVLRVDGFRVAARRRVVAPAALAARLVVLAARLVVLAARRRVEAVARFVVVAARRFVLAARRRVVVAARLAVLEARRRVLAAVRREELAARRVVDAPRAETPRAMSCTCLLNPSSRFSALSTSACLAARLACA